MLYRARGSSAERSDFGPIDEIARGQSRGPLRPGGRAVVRHERAAVLQHRDAGARHRRRRRLERTLGGGRWTKRAEPARARPHGRDGRDPFQAPARGRSPDAVRGPPLLEERRTGWPGTTCSGASSWPTTCRRPAASLSRSPSTTGSDSAGPFPCNEYVCATESYAIGMIDRLHQFGIGVDACWIDAGWYENATNQWWSGVGTWTVNRKNFPNGLKPVTAAARKYGQGFVVWFEPERVYEGTWLDREHKDWLTFLPGKPQSPARPGQPEGARVADRPRREFHPGRGRDGLPAGFQLRPGAVLEGHGRAGPRRDRRDEAHRGLYKYWDALLERNPGLLIDNCASGGRRIDLETTSRSIPLWRTDYQYYEPNGYQCHTYGLHFFLPASGTGNGDPRKYWFRSAAIGGAVVMGWELGASFNVRAAIEDVAEFQAAARLRLRRLLSADGVRDGR
ncbi:MAG: alpha-galactosidase [Sphingobacterium sp.]|nr:alpha-galactosidase [Sphingobacterium sp.]